VVKQSAIVPGYSVTLRNNVVYNWNSPALQIENQNYNTLTVENNKFQQVAYPQPLVSHFQGIVPGTIYTGNSYFSSASQAQWFSVNGVNYNFAGWLSQSGETGAQTSQINFLDPNRTVETYDTQFLGGPGTFNHFISLVRQQSKDNWNLNLTANAVNQWIRVGFNL
jgi:hypothetical protein